MTIRNIADKQFVITRVSKESHAGTSFVQGCDGYTHPMNYGTIQKGIDIINFTKRKNNP